MPEVETSFRRADPVTMYAAYIMKRTQIYLDGDQSRELASRAKRRGTTSSHVIREAIDEYLARPETEDERRLQRFRAAVEEAYGAARQLPGGAEYVEKLRAADVARTARIDEQRSQ
jgi:predicted DNA-binding protein